MDPASAIGVASGVLSFVEATYKVLAIAYAVYESDQVGGYDELSAATDMLRDLSQQILSGSTSTSPGTLDASISSLANAALYDATERTRAKRNQRNIMSSLRFESMLERHSMVSEAADATFDWIFDNPKKEMESNLDLVRSLKDWVDQGTGIFHISAKPGAGKSALMKYLWSNPQTQEKLRSWADPHLLAMASFFFWKHGPQQKNQDGMMRSLLHPSAETTPRYDR